MTNPERESPQQEPREDIVIGRRAVSEVLTSGRPVDCIWVAKGERTGGIVPLLARCRELGLLIKEADSRKLDALSGGDYHQGIVAVCAAAAYVEPEDLFAAAERAGEPPFLLFCDEIADPHNLGAILRTVDAVGAHGVVIPKRRSVGLTAAVYKTSAGAAAHVPVARVSNLAQAIRDVKARGVWVYGLDMDGDDLFATRLDGAVALVVGAEGRGLSRLTRELCDGIVSLPMRGQVGSLNASVACGIALYRVGQSRGIS